MAQVLFKTAYGSSQEYAEACAARLSTTATTWEDGRSLRTLLADAAGPTVVFSYAHGPKVPGVEAAIAAWKSGRPTALCVVGMTLSAHARRNDAVANQVGEDVKRFYLPGRMNYSELSASHFAIMSGIVSGVRMKPRSLRSENDQAMIDAFRQDINRVDLGELDPVVAWANSF